jgi:hypothetical protein
MARTEPASSANSKNSPKSQAFQRLAIQRTNAVLEKLRLLGNLSNTATYEYSSDEVSKIFAAITKELRKARSKFEGTGGEGRFEL